MRAPCPLSVMDDACETLDCAGDGSAGLREARTAVAELVAADREYEAARMDWDRTTASHPGDISEKSWQRIADRFEAAVMRRAAALAKFGGAA